MELAVSRLGTGDVDRAYANCTLFWQMPRSNEKLVEFLSDECNVLVVAELDGKPVGQALGYIVRRWDVKLPKLFLYSIDVAEMHRRQGIGRRLVEAFRQVGQESGCGSTFVPTSEQNIPAVRLHEAIGGKRATDSHAVIFEWVR